MTSLVPARVLALKLWRLLHPLLWVSSPSFHFPVSHFLSLCLSFFSTAGWASGWPSRDSRWLQREAVRVWLWLLLLVSEPRSTQLCITGGGEQHLMRAYSQHCLPSFLPKNQNTKYVTGVFLIAYLIWNNLDLIIFFKSTLCNGMIRFMCKVEYV